MIAAIRFDRDFGERDGRRIRGASFALRSSLPLSAACAVANAVRESLVRLLQAEFELEVAEPAIPAEAGKAALFEGALVYRVRGAACDAFIVIRPADARRLAAAAFGEAARNERDALSAIERSTVDRIATSIGSQCSSLCGVPAGVSREDLARARAECVTYFEVRSAAPRRVSIGFGLTRDPDEPRGERLTLDALLDVEVEARVEIGHGPVSLHRWTALTPGETVALGVRLDECGRLFIAGVAFAAVTCGRRGARSAISVAHVSGEAPS